MIYIFMCVLYILFEILVSRCVFIRYFLEFLCVRFFLKGFSSSIEDLLLAREKMAELFDEEVTETKGFDEFSINTVSTHHTTETMEAGQFMHPLQLNDELAFQTIKTKEKKNMEKESKNDMQSISSSTISRNTVHDERVKTKSSLDIKMTEEERQLLHPLELNDKLAFETIKTVTLNFLTEEAKAPIPRCQALPDHAFSKLTGRSILVALSHGWFFQTHPDPYGEKLDLIRNVFAPKLRERYPHTDIQVFFDYLASPQRPRTKSEDKIFAVAMDRMNSMYVYADVIVFLEVDLPTIGMTVHTSDVDLSRYKFFDFVDTIQVSETSSKQGPQQFDCIQTWDSNQVTSSEQLHKLTSIHTLTYLHRPFGRPNTIINDDRGWLFLERITIAIKAAAAEKSQFDDIVVSNSEKLRLQIYKWCERLRDAASKQSSEPQALPDLLNQFDNELKSKRFSFSSDEDVVRGLMKKLVNQFANDWKGEVEKQKSMSRRAKEILLRWGEFSEQYVERAGFLRKESETWIEISRTLSRMFLLLVCPMFMLYLFTFDVLEDPAEDTYMTGSMFAAAGMCITSNLVHAPMKLEFISIHVGYHTVLDIVQAWIQCFFFSVLLRTAFGVPIVPFEFLWICILSVTIGNKVVFGPNVIRTTHPRTKEKIKTSILPYLSFPPKFRFRPDVEAKNEVLRRYVDTFVYSLSNAYIHTHLQLHISFVHFTYLFGFLYPIIGGIFFNSGVFVQACIVPLFFVVRASYEYGADAMTSKTFGSDGMYVFFDPHSHSNLFNELIFILPNHRPVICLAGVGMHEICLTLMMTSISHPLIFIMLILCDILENAFCLWSLHRTINRVSKRSNKIVPEYKRGDKNGSSHEIRKTLIKRSSSVYSLMKDLDTTTSIEERQGTALFIAATLLQRELIEAFVPIQAMGIISLLYVKP